MSTTNSTMFHVCVGDFDKRITYKVRSLVKMYEGGTLVMYSSSFFFCFLVELEFGVGTGEIFINAGIATEGGAR